MEFRDIIAAGILHEISDNAKRKLKKAGKIGAGAAALGGAGYAAYQNKDAIVDKAGEAAKKVKETATSVKEKVEDKLTDKKDIYKSAMGNKGGFW